MYSISSVKWKYRIYIITERRHYSFDLPQDGLEVPCSAYTLHFSGDAKLGRSYKLSASKNINIDRI